MQKAECFGTYGQIQALILDPDSTGMTRANALLEATWQAKIDDSLEARCLILNPEKPLNVVAEKEDAVFVEGNTGKKVRARKGKFTLQLEYDNLTFCFMNSLRTLDNAIRYGYFITSENVIIADGDDTNLTPVEMQFYVSDPIPPADNSNLWTLKIDVEIIPVSNYFNVAVSPVDATISWKPLEALVGIYNISLTSITADVSDQKVVFTVDTKCGGSDITSFVTHGDWQVALTSAPTAILTSASIANTNNVYTLTMAAVQLTAAPHIIWRKSNDLCTDQGYETRDNAGAIETFAFTPVP